MTRKKRTTLPRANVTIFSTGLKFKVGDAIAPSWDDLFAILKNTWELQIPELVPDHYDYDILVTMSRDQAKKIVPELLAKIDSAYTMGRIPAEHEDRIKISAYVMAWWHHRRAGGPRPLTTKREEDAPIVPLKPLGRIIPDLQCPFCFHPYQPPSNYKSRKAIAYHWQKWLKKHFDTYHTDWS